MSHSPTTLEWENPKQKKAWAYICAIIKDFIITEYADRKLIKHTSFGCLATNVRCTVYCLRTAVILTVILLQRLSPRVHKVYHFFPNQQSVICVDGRHDLVVHLTQQHWLTGYHPDLEYRTVVTVERQTHQRVSSFHEYVSTLRAVCCS